MLSWRFYHNSLDWSVSNSRVSGRFLALLCFIEIPVYVMQTVLWHLIWVCTVCQLTLLEAAEDSYKIWRFIFFEKKNHNVICFSCNCCLIHIRLASYNKSTASTAPCPATALTSSKCHNSVKIKSKGRCICLSLNIINIVACTCVNLAMFNVQKAITPKVGKPELQFMCPVSRFMVLSLHLCEVSWKYRVDMSTQQKWLFQNLLFSKGCNSKRRLTRVTVFVFCALSHCVLQWVLWEKFHILKGFQLIERTRVHGRNGYVQSSKGNNSKSRQTRVTVHVCCTLTHSSLHLCEVSWKYLKQYQIMEQIRMMEVLTDGQTLKISESIFVAGH